MPTFSARLSLMRPALPMAPCRSRTRPVMDGGPVDRGTDCARTERRVSRVRGRLPAVLLTIGVWFSISVLPAAAQAVRGRVLDEGTSSPVIGAHVILMDSAGTPSFSTLTNDLGVFVLQVPAAGRYRVRVEMIGRRTVDSGMFGADGPDVANITVTLPREPVRLAGLDVRASQKCQVRPSSGLPTQTVWDEARKALSVEAAVREQRLYRFDISRFTRELEESGRRVVNEQAKYVSRFSGDPFVSRPAEQLVAEGYSEPDGEDFIFYGPNGTVLLSDPFLDTHCFYLRRDRDHRGEIGLAFEPVRERKLTDVEGVLWLNEQTAELRSLEFTYTNTPPQLPPAKRGGEATFQRLPNGAFIVREWSIRSPIFQRTESSFGGQRVGGEHIVGYYVDGGEVINIIDRTGRIVDASPRAVLAGIVYDSTTAAPLDSANVTLVGTNYAGRTDAQGRFRIVNLPPGVYSVGFSHARTNSWRWTPPPVEVELKRGAITEVELGIPKAGPPLVLITDASRRDSLAAIGRAAGHPEWASLLMPAAVPTDLAIDTTGATGRMRGRVLDENGNPVTGAHVAIDSLRYTTESGDDGRFRIDAMRPGVHVMVVTFPGYLRNETRVPLHPGQFLDAEVRLERAPGGAQPGP
jgi:Carboxypeptidase regulatory-like domain